MSPFLVAPLALLTVAPASTGAIRLQGGVADELQNSVMHVLWGTVWPVCPAHHLGAHAREHDGTAVWWCNGSGGHVIVAIGTWNR